MVRSLLQVVTRLAAILVCTEVCMRTLPLQSGTLSLAESTPLTLRFLVLKLWVTATMIGQASALGSIRLTPPLDTALFQVVMMWCRQVCMSSETLKPSVKHSRKIKLHMRSMLPRSAAPVTMIPE